MTTAEGIKAKNIHLQCGLAVDMIIKSSLVRRTFDNVTVVLVAFKNFETIFEEEKGEIIKKPPYIPIYTTGSNNMKTFERNLSDNNLQSPNEKQKNGFGGGGHTNSNISSINTSNKGHNPSLSTNISSLNNMSATIINNINNNYISNNHNPNLLGKNNFQSIDANNNSISANNYLKTDSNTINLQDKIQSIIDKKPKIRNLSEIIDKNNYFNGNKTATTTKNTTGNKYKPGEESVFQYFTKPDIKYDMLNNKPLVPTKFATNTCIENSNNEAEFLRANTEAVDYKEMPRNNKGSTSKIVSNNSKALLKSNFVTSNQNSIQKNASMNSKNFNVILGGNMAGGLSLSKPGNNSRFKLKTIDIKKKKYDVVDNFESLGSGGKKKIEEKKNVNDFMSNLPLTTKNSTTLLKSKENTYEILKKRIQQPIRSYNFKK